VCSAQHKDSVVALQAYRIGMQIDPKTGKVIDFVLCGDDLTTDSSHFFSMLSGCERNVHLLVGRYSMIKDTFLVSPFNFVQEGPFARIYKIRSAKPIQTVKFFSANYKPLNGRDSSWIVRCFKKRKQNFLDCSANGIVKVGRGKYDGIELMQLSKIFHLPTVMFLDSRFDYIVIVNLPEAPLKRFITGANAIKGKAFIVKDSLYFEGSRDGFKITSR
jgi:hypothetical protein